MEMHKDLKGKSHAVKVYRVLDKRKGNEVE